MRYLVSFIFVLISSLDYLILASEKPNIIVIMADDLGYESLSANGSESCSSPNLDKLAAGGVRFTNCFSNPICTPSRVKIMTGQYNVRNYVEFGVLDRGQTTFAHQLKTVGYKTCIAGKWQLGSQTDSPQHFGFDQSCLWQHTRTGRSKENGKNIDRRFVNPLLEINGKEKDYIKGEYGPQICTEFICDFIDKNKENPFLIYYPMILTHCPFDPTPDSTDWDPKRLGSTTYKGDRNEPQRHFRDMVAYADKLVGQIFVQLEKSGIRENTLLIFTGDNGTDKPIVTSWNGTKIAGDKGNMTDAGMRVPLIASWPAGNQWNTHSCISHVTLVTCDLCAIPRGYDRLIRTVISGKNQKSIFTNTRLFKLYENLADKLVSISHHITKMSLRLVTITFVSS